mgnify:CR=1 FL=1
MKSKVKDKAWAAGLFDGEGCIMIKRDYNNRQGKRQVTFSLRLILTNNHVGALEKFKLIAGNIGSIRQWSRDGRKNPTWDWRTASKQAETVLKLLLPYLVVKREQAELALLSRKYQQKVGAYRPNPNKDEIEELRLQISSLNQGRAVPLQ